MCLSLPRGQRPGGGVLVTTPAEHIASRNRRRGASLLSLHPGLAVLTVRFKVGEPRTDALVRLYNAFYSKWHPANPAIGQALIKPRGIDDVPILSLALFSRNRAATTSDLC